MLENVKKQILEVEGYEPKTKDELEQFRLKYMSKKGIVAQLFEDFRNVAAENKKEYGVVLNTLKVKVQQIFDENKEKLESVGEKKSSLDLTMPGESVSMGSRHPISIVKNHIIEIFTRLGFTVAEGPEIEDDWHDFRT